MSVTLETKCWEGDWESILKSNHLQKLAENNCYPFAERVLLINNVSDYGLVCAYADQALERGWISRYVVVKNHADHAMRHFQLTENALGNGYVYSIAELVGILVCETDYLLHFSGDAWPQRPVCWIHTAIDLLQADPSVKVANLSWDDDGRGARAESRFATRDFYVGQGFSDQCYLVRAREFRRSIYLESHPASDRYPKYGGELFEKRVDAWMRNHAYLRATFRYGSYQHAPTPKSGIA